MGASIRKQSVRIDSGVTVPGEPALRLALDVHIPEHGASIVLVCLPGGAMNRRYYDLQADNDDSYSFAAQMTRRGLACVLVDHAGVGDSDHPVDGYALTPDVVAQANEAAIAKALAGLRAGILVDGVPAMPALRSVILGHSMGGMFAVLQQAALHRHAAVAVLGFCTRGLAQYLPPAAHALAEDRNAHEAEIVRLARAMFVEPYPRVKPSQPGNSIFSGSSAEPAGVQALKRAADNMLPVPAFYSMVPNNVLREAQTIDVPVFIGVGERDMVGPAHEIPASFPASRDLTLQVLPEAGHSHFLFAARRALFDRLAVWAHGLFDAQLYIPNQ